MRFRLRKYRLFEAALTGVAALGLSASYSPAAEPPPAPCWPSSAGQPIGGGDVRPQTPQGPSGAQTPSPVAPSEQPQAQASPEFGAEAGGATAGGEAAVPNMLGALLNGSRSISFGLLRTLGNTNVVHSLSTGVTNPSVAENNSPIPQDRLYFRYNYYHNAQSVIGLDGSIPAPQAPGVQIALPQQKDYDYHQYTFGGEKTFFDNLMSVEVRVPFRTTLASSNFISAGNSDGPTVNPPSGRSVDANGNPFFITNSTPENTLGHEDTEFGDMSVILKGLLYQRCGLAISGGLGVGIPTSQDTNLLIHDFGSTATDLPKGKGSVTRVNSDERLRAIHVHNDIVGLSPFVAFLATPTDRLFLQGFVQYDFPVNKDRIDYAEARFGPFGPVTFGNPVPPPTSTNIEEQQLLHFDIGTGFWLVRNCDGWITGIAPTVELHYTTTLTNAQIVQLPGDGSTFFVPNDFKQSKTEQGPQVGNQRGRMDILDLTLGTTFLIGDRTSFATGVVVPLRSGDNKVFDWEAQVQLNWYFGGPRTRVAPAFE